jgi:hypothetical protein
VRILKGLLRFYFLAPLHARGYAASDMAVALTGVLALAVWLLLDRWAAGTDAELWLYGVEGLVW